MRSVLSFSLLAVVSLAAACAPGPHPPSGQWAGPADPERYRGFLVPAPLLPLRVAGSVLFDYRGERETGGLDLEGNADLAFLLRLSTRLLGTAALEVRFDRSRLLVLDFAEETYYLGENTADTRLKLFSIDLTPEEFLIVLTGRVPREVFARGGGAYPTDGEAVYRQDGAIYRFTLGEHGLPRGWSKQRAGRSLFRVEYRDYLAVDDGQGPPLWLPRKIRVYVDDTVPRLVLGIREFQPWIRGDGPLRFEVDPAAGLRFRPLPEEAWTEEPRSG